MVYYYYWKEVGVLINSFKRREKKFLITKEQFEAMEYKVESEVK